MPSGDGSKAFAVIVMFALLMFGAVLGLFIATQNALVICH